MNNENGQKPKDLSDARTLLGKGALKTGLLAATEDMPASRAGNGSRPSIQEPIGREAGRTDGERKGAPSVLNVLTLEEILSYEHTPESLLCGDGVIEAGGITLLFGAPGSFKGFAIGHLMGCGAWGSGRWLGFDVKSRFASLWVNCENGRRRLKSQIQKMKLPPDAGDYIHATDIPGVWSLGDPRMVAELRQTITAKNIRLVILDTVSNFAGDEMAKDFNGFFAMLNTALHGLPWKVAELLIHHARKPKDGDKGGRGLLHMISGHQTLQRRSRCILFIGRVTDELTERRVVSVCLKCSDSGESEGVRTAMRLDDTSTLAEIPNFEWSEWTDGNAGKKENREPRVSEDDVREVFDGGETWLATKDAAARLMEVASVKRSAAYDALKLQGGRFSDILRRREDGLIGLEPSPFDGD